MLGVYVSFQRRRLRIRLCVTDVEKFKQIAHVSTYFFVVGKIDIVQRFG